MNESAWDRPGIAISIDAYWAQSHEVTFRKRVVTDLGPRLQAGDILEVGCGSGLIYEALLQADLLKEHVYRGGDSSKAMLRLARKRFPDQKFIQLDILDIQAQADNVLCIQVLQHLADWRPALYQLLDASRKLLYIVTWFGEGRQHFDTQTGFWQNWLNYKELTDVCQHYGRVERVEFGETVSSVTVYR